VDENYQSQIDGGGVYQYGYLDHVFPFLIDAMLWTDGTSYVEEFLPAFGLPITTVIDSHNRADAHVVLRHDVDWSLENALMMAKLEETLGIKASYYLLHPDGFVKEENYFGRVVDGKLLIKESLFDAAKQFMDMGHEVGLHNDLFSLALYTGVEPSNLLDQIIDAFNKRSIPIRGSVAHGSPLCGKHGFINYQIFEECKKAFVSEAYKGNVVENGNFSFKKYTVKMVDYGLEYEANFVPREVCVSDSGGTFVFSVSLGS
jgi:hypothetical protein